MVGVAILAGPTSVRAELEDSCDCCLLPPHKYASVCVHVQIIVQQYVTHDSQLNALPIHSRARKVFCSVLFVCLLY